MYSRFERWGEYVAAREWEADFIPEINSAIAQLDPGFPSETEALRELLFEPLVSSMTGHAEHRQRYVAAVCLQLYDDDSLARVGDKLEQAAQDEHGSVRSAANILLKRLRGA